MILYLSVHIKKFGTLLYLAFLCNIFQTYRGIHFLKTHIAALTCEKIKQKKTNMEKI